MSTVQWTENGFSRTARWQSDADLPVRVRPIDDRLPADAAIRRARAGTGLLWRGDFPAARALLAAMGRRIPATGSTFPEVRAARACRAALLGKLLVELEPDHSVRLRRAPDVRAACTHAFGTPERRLIPLRTLLGAVSAYAWHRTGLDVPEAGGRIHPAYGVFSPTRREYLSLVAEEPLPRNNSRVAFDLGAGTGVLAAILARRGVPEVVATDLNPRAVRCARDNVQRLGLGGRVSVLEADLWPPGGRAGLVVCNPPWLPGTPASELELGIYDASSAMLHRFLDGLAEHLAPGGEGWLVLSDLAERLGLRTRADLLTRIAAAGLRVAGVRETPPRHPRAADRADPLHAQRSRERVALWRLAIRRSGAVP
jgi:methylase of polypeptide subunit release factors